MSSYALLDARQIVVNVIRLDDPAAWTPPAGCTLLADEAGTAKIGLAWNPDTAAFESVDLPATAAAKAAAIARVNAEAGAFRASIATDIPFQSEVYASKRAEAERYAASGGTGRYPYLEAEAAATGVTLATMAAEISTIAAAWTTASVQVEAARRGAIVAIEAATTLDEIAAAIPMFARP